MISIRRALSLAAAGGVLCLAAPHIPAAQAAAVPCTGLHPMIVKLCPDGTSIGYECDQVTGRWVMGTCPPPLIPPAGEPTG